LTEGSRGPVVNPLVIAAQAAHDMVLFANQFAMGPAARARVSAGWTSSTGCWRDPARYCHPGMTRRPWTTFRTFSVSKFRTSSRDEFLTADRKGPTGNLGETGGASR